ncbi:hypothetical protein D3C87_1546610 [compost metagenome]
MKPCWLPLLSSMTFLGLLHCRPACPRYIAVSWLQCWKNLPAYQADSEICRVIMAPLKCGTKLARKRTAPSAAVTPANTVLSLIPPSLCCPARISLSVIRSTRHLVWFAQLHVLMIRSTLNYYLTTTWRVLTTYQPATHRSTPVVCQG